MASKIKGAQSRGSYTDNVIVGCYNGHIADTILQVRPSKTLASGAGNAVHESVQAQVSCSVSLTGTGTKKCWEATSTGGYIYWILSEDRVGNDSYSTCMNEKNNGRI